VTHASKPESSPTPPASPEQDGEAQSKRVVSMTGRFLGLPKTRRSAPADAEGGRQVAWAVLRALVDKEDLTTEDLPTVLGATLEKVTAATGAGGAFFLLADSERKQADVLAARLPGLAPAEAMETIDHLEGQSVPLASMGFLAWGAWTRESLFLRDIPSGVTVPAVLKDALGEVTSAVSAPMRVSDRLTGVLLALNKRGKARFSHQDLHLIEEVAEYSCCVIKRALGLGDPLSPRAMGRYVALVAGLPYLELEGGFSADRGLCDLVGRELIERYQVLPLRKLNSEALRVALTNPLDFQSLQDFEAVSGWKLRERVVVAAGAIQKQVDRLYPQDRREIAGPKNAELDGLALELGGHHRVSDPAFREVEVTQASPPIVRLANRLIEEAFRAGASDIHVEARERDVLVRFRVDGMCRDLMRLPTAALRTLVARLKIMSDLDIAEHRLPQDGRIAFKRFNPALDLDLRVSVMPMLFGECVVLRLLDKGKTMLPLDDLGFSERNLARYRKLVRLPYGMLLHCGPTGSGKSMTLYAALNEVSNPEQKVVTAEDPVEYTLPQINQLQVKQEIGLSFASALRCFLRHDPDIILVGEIRDGETALIAIEAALTGHMLLSTLHTNDAVSAVGRLVRLGVEPFLVANTLVGLCAQRLLRRLCLCKTTRPPEAEEIQHLGWAEDGNLAELHVPNGCGRCGQTGYRGRTGVYELLVASGRIRERITEGATALELTALAKQQGMLSLYEEAMAKVRVGTTSLEEALRVCPPPLE
jgi:type IV pilus assembly protein PilB